MRARYKNLSIETIFDVVPATEKELRRMGCSNVSRYKWMTSDGKMPFTEDEIEILEEDENKCICETLKKYRNAKYSLAYDNYTDLQIGYGWIGAYAEGGAVEDIQYCPFCGKKFE